MSLHLSSRKELDMNKEILTVNAQNERIKRGWEHFRGTPVKRLEIRPPVFKGHPRYARPFSYELALQKLVMYCCGHTDVDWRTVTEI